MDFAHFYHSLPADQQTAVRKIVMLLFGWGKTTFYKHLNDGDYSPLEQLAVNFIILLKRTPQNESNERD